MSWYPPTGGAHPPPNHHPQQQPAPNPQMPHTHFQQPPPTTATYNNSNQNQQWPHQQPVNYQAPGNTFQGPPAPVPATSWNTSHGPTFFKPADMNQNFAAPAPAPPQPQPPAMTTQAPPPQNNNNNNNNTNDGWGDWGDEWAQDGGSANNSQNPNTGLDNYQQQQQQLPPPPQNPSYNDQFYVQQPQQVPPPNMYTPANYPAPPPVTFDGQGGQEAPASNVIADSFSASTTDSWNWNSTGAPATIDSNANQVELIRKPVVFNKMSTSAVEKIVQTGGPGSNNNTSHPPVANMPPVTVPTVGNTASASTMYNTNQPDDMKSQSHYGGQEQNQNQYQQQQHQSQQAFNNNNQQTNNFAASDDLDPLDMALMQMNVGGGQSEQQQPQFNNASSDNGANFFGGNNNNNNSGINSLSIPSTTAEGTSNNQTPFTVENQEVVLDQSSAPSGGEQLQVESNPISMDSLESHQNFMTTPHPPPVNTATPPLAMPPTGPPPVSMGMLPPSGGVPPTAGSVPASSGGNPFKRSGSAVHRNLGFNAPAASATTQQSTVPPIPQPTPPPMVQQLPMTITAPPEQQSFFTPAPQQSMPMGAVQSQEDYQHQAPPQHNNNDRNEYLQTDQLSEDIQSTGNFTQEEEPVQSETFDHLPPPGLSRLVLGETEEGQQFNSIPQMHHQQQQQSLNAHNPPPGLNRMIPGTESLEGTSVTSSDMADMQREADGQDDDVSTGTGYPPVTPNELTDRNLYRVPGESHQEQQSQQSHHPPSRVVTGDENAVPFVQPVIQENIPQTSNSSHVEVAESRDMQQVEGENALDDDNVRFNRQHGESVMSREEPIEGENAGDDVVISSGGAAAIGITEVVADISAGETGPPPPVTSLNPRKETSTGEDSDRERSSYYNNNKSKATRNRNEDMNSGSLRRKPKHHERYDSESDTSEKRESNNHNRKNFDRSYASERQRGGEDRDGRRRRGGGGMDESSRHNRSDRRMYGDRRDEEYDRGYARGEGERRSKRYNADEDRDHHERRGRNEVDAKRADKERQYRKDRDRDRDDRRGGEESRRYPREKDPRRYEYEDERYNRSGSRNTDRSRDPRYAQGGGTGGGYYGPNYGHYDPYTSYYTAQQQQQMQYYENLRRTNPQAYAEWYRKYYMQAATGAGMAAGGVPGGAVVGQSDVPTDGRESVHSGRSSTNDKDRYNRMSMSTGYYQQQQQSHYGGPPAMDGSLMMDTSGYGGPSSLMSSYSYSQYGHGQPLMQPQSMPRAQVYTPSGHHLQQASFYAPSDISDSRHAGQQQQQNEKDANRMTPFKYTNEHGQVSLSNGLMVCVKPKYSQNGVVNRVKIINIGALASSELDADRRLLAVYPGPLVRGVTHKKTVIEFCEERLRVGPAGSAMVAPGREQSLLRSHANSMTSLCSVTQHSGQQPAGQQNQFKASYNLLWNLLILLLRQNGTVVGTDIAELLIKNATEFPTTNANLVIIEKAEDEAVKSIPTSATDRPVDAGDASLSDINSDESNEENNALSSLATKASNLTEEQITEKFRNHLLYGNVTEALDWATENNLWGHALFLASKMDRRSHLNVMMKFANKLALNDPLQTLYQLMSLRMPSFVTSVVDKKWGDWRPHLAMILSNTSQKPELDRKAITTLGDSLFHNGDVYGSHFCYLMAQVGFGKYEPWTPETVNSGSAPKLILLGSSPLRSFKEFATTEAIMMTEIYEYAVTLNDESYMIAEYQPYKFTLATRLLDYGHQLKAFLYMEQLAKNIKRDPTKFEWPLVNNVYVFADRLRYYDPVQEKSMDNNDSQDSEGDHQKWIQELKEFTVNPSLQQQQSYYNGDQQQQQQLQNPEQATEQRGGSIDRQFAEINQQFNQLNLQYQNYDQVPPQQPQGDYYGQQQESQQVPAEQQQQDHYPQPNYGHRDSVTDSVPPPQSMDASEVNPSYDPYGYQQQQQPPAQDQYQQSPLGNFYNPTAYGDSSAGFSQPQEQSQDTTGGYDYYGQQQQQSEEQPKSKGSKSTSMAAPKPPKTVRAPPKNSVQEDASDTEVSAHDNHHPNHPQRHSNPMLNGRMTRHGSLTGGGGGSKYDSGVMNYGIRSNSTESQGRQDPVATDWTAPVNPSSENDYEQPRPQISMPSSMSSRPGFYEDDAGGKSAPGGSQQQSKQQAADKQSGKGDKDKSLPTGKGNDQSSGWFGGIWGKLSLKPKNQMILPDDKNPSIVWDPDKKRWINQDEGEAEGEAFKPPPKMSELNLPQQQQQPPQMAPIPAMSQGMPPPAQSPAFMGAPAPVPAPSMAPMMMMNPGQQQPSAEDASAVDGGGGNRVPTNNLQSNQFKLQRNRTLKKSYVDVFNPSGAPMKAADNIMAPSGVPTIPQGGFFIPGAAPMGQQQQQQNFN